MPVKQVNAAGIDSSLTTVNYLNTPDECPMCHHGVHPRLVTGVILGQPTHPESEIRIVFQCTRTECQEVFLGYYDFKSTQQDGTFYLLGNVAPMEPVEAAFSESIGEVSTNFIEIYNQAMAAEAHGLDQINGLALRKALEFLIKDFLINQDPSKADEIKGKLLGKCIEENLTDPNIKASAKLATWLGNDETHYVRKWEDKDINDLKILIRLTVNWIDNVLLTQKYVKSMNA
jgi:hypothetical protein